MPFGKPKAPKEPKAPKAPKEKKPKKPKKPKPPKAKKPKKGQELPVEETAEGEEGEQDKKKLPLPFLIVSLAVIVAAVVIVFLFVIPKLRGDDPDAVESVEPSPPVLPSELPVGDNTVPGMVLGSDEYQAQAVLAKTITYTYTDLADAGKVAETYVGQLRAAEDRFSIVDEEFVRVKDEPDFTAAEGMVLMARNLPKPEPEVEETPEPTPDPEGESADPDASATPSEEPSEAPTESAEPVDEPPDMVLTVRITWSKAEGTCVVTADEEEGLVTSPASATIPAQHPVSQRGAVQQLKKLDPAMLGLTGTSMEPYEIIPMDGTEMVNELTCIRMHVYTDNNVPNSNEFMGSYLMSIDGDHLYRVDPITDEITEVEGYEYTP